MAGFIVKLLVAPLGVMLADALFRSVNYPSIWYPIIIGAIIAVVGYFMEVTLLKRGTVWISTALDFFAATFIVYFASLLLPGSQITFWGALLTGFIIAATEHAQHIWLVQSGRVKHSGQRI